MPTTVRYYLTTKAAPVDFSPIAYHSSWTDTDDALRYSTEKVSPPVSNFGNATMDTSVDTVAIARQSVTGSTDLPQGRVSGTVRMVQTIGTLSGTQSPTFLRLVVRVVSENGDQIRGTLFVGQSINPSANLGGASSRTVSGDLTPVIAHAGDRLLIEIGAAINYDQSTIATIFGGLVSQPDLPFQDGVPSAGGRGWVEFVFDDLPQSIWETNVVSGEYEAGVDQGVLYPPVGEGVPWPGLLSVVEDESVELNPLYFDGIKYADGQAIGEYTAKVKAITYPPELDDHYRFGFSYRTSEGRYIHLVYNVVARPTTQFHQTVSSRVDMSDFEWTVSSVPILLNAFRPAGHFVIDTQALTSMQLRHLENALYGSDTSDPYLPTIEELSAIVQVEGEWVFTDNGNGLWNATGPDELYSNLGGGRHQLREVDATLLGSGRYSIPV